MKPKSFEALQELFYVCKGVIIRRFDVLMVPPRSYYFVLICYDIVQLCYIYLGKSSRCRASLTVSYVLLLHIRVVFPARPDDVTPQWGDVRHERAPHGGCGQTWKLPRTWDYREYCLLCLGKRCPLLNVTHPKHKLRNYVNENFSYNRKKNM